MYEITDRELKREKKSGPNTVMGDVILGMKDKELSVRQEKKGKSETGEENYECHKKLRG